MDWDTLARQIDADGFAVTPEPLLDPVECRELREGFGDGRRYRSTVDMARFRFGEGCYRYFRYPLPPVVAALRQATYAPLATIANRWHEQLGETGRFPADLAQLTARCHEAGQNRATPLVLRYEAGGYNCLHRDLYGEVAFPLQLTAFLSRRGADYTGGDFLLVEQRPRAQSRGDAIPTEQGELLFFTTAERPVRGSRGYFRAGMRHGVSRVRSGSRYTLGIIFHDAR